MGESRKRWTKAETKRYLGVISPALEKLEKLANGAGQMPAPLRKKIIATNIKIRSLMKDLQGWAITADEKVLAGFRPEDYPPSRGPSEHPGGKSKPVKKLAKKPSSRKSPEISGKVTKKPKTETKKPKKAIKVKQFSLFDRLDETTKKSGKGVKQNIR